MGSRRKGEDRVPPVELADGEQVHRRHQHADPSGAEDRVELQLRAPMEPSLEERGAERGAEEQPVGRESARRFGCAGDAGYEKRKRDREARNRPGGRDVEQGLPRRNRAPDPDDGTERPDQHGGSRDEERQRRGNAVVAAGEVVAHLVGPENRQQEGRVGDAVREAARVEELTPRSVVVPELLPEPASRDRRGREGGDKKRGVKPPSHPWRTRRPRGGKLVHGRRSIPTVSLGADGVWTPQRTLRRRIYPSTASGYGV
jgi:hypothetical protein